MTESSRAKLKLHQGLIAIHIYFMFHEIPVSRYLVMAYLIGFKSIQGQ